MKDYIKLECKTLITKILLGNLTYLFQNPISSEHREKVLSANQDVSPHQNLTILAT